MKKQILDIKIAGETNIGLHRSRNEDSFLVCRPDEYSALACVADGIGSHSDGKIASSICCRDLLDAAMQYSEEKFSDPENFLRTTIAAVNEKLFERNYREIRPRPMGSTAVSAFFEADLITVANVGDSRLYEYFAGREEPFRQVTVDHRPDEELLDKLSEKYNQDKRTLRSRVLLHSLGTRHRATIDIYKITPITGAVYLLCSDGLCGRVPDDNIAAILAEPGLSVRELTSRLVREALIFGGRDNISVITARYGE
ncbi:MAG: serine/threonine-protein phosphatase [Lentisphaeria bacterium]|nr:serine/threonine-protein phosphatase [Lentisphaeria bacterium]